MTEDEAKLKTCCGPQLLTLLLVLGKADERTVELTDNPGRCIGASCMAWRWAGHRAKDGTWVRKTAGEPWRPEMADGYCGLAGSP